MHASEEEMSLGIARAAFDEFLGELQRGLYIAGGERRLGAYAEAVLVEALCEQDGQEQRGHLIRTSAAYASCG